MATGILYASEFGNPRNNALASPFSITDVVNARTDSRLGGANWHTEADSNGDCIVDISDATILANNYGKKAQQVIIVWESVDVPKIGRPSSAARNRRS